MQVYQNVEVDFLPDGRNQIAQLSCQFAGAAFEKPLTAKPEEWWHYVAPWYWTAVDMLSVWKISKDGSRALFVQDVSVRLEREAVLKPAGPSAPRYYGYDARKLADLFFAEASKLTGPALLFKRPSKGQASTTVTDDPPLEAPPPPDCPTGELFRVMSSASTTLPPLNVALNFAHFVDAPVQNGTPGLNENDQVLVFPIFSASFAQAHPALEKPSVLWTPVTVSGKVSARSNSFPEPQREIDPETGGPTGRWFVQYRETRNSDTNMYAVSQPLSLAPPAPAKKSKQPARIIDFDQQRIKLTISDGPEQLFSLFQRVAALWDLPAMLVDYVRQEEVFSKLVQFKDPGLALYNIARFTLSTSRDLAGIGTLFDSHQTLIGKMSDDSLYRVVWREVYKDDQSGKPDFKTFQEAIYLNPPRTPLEPMKPSEWDAERLKVATLAENDLSDLGAFRNTLLAASEVDAWITEIAENESAWTTLLSKLAHGWFVGNDVARRVQQFKIALQQAAPRRDDLSAVCREFRDSTCQSPLAKIVEVSKRMLDIAESFNKDLQELVTQAGSLEPTSLAEGWDDFRKGPLATLFRRTTNQPKKIKDFWKDNSVCAADPRPDIQLIKNVQTQDELRKWLDRLDAFVSHLRSSEKLPQIIYQQWTDALSRAYTLKSETLTKIAKRLGAATDDRDPKDIPADDKRVVPVGLTTYVTEPLERVSLWDQSIVQAKLEDPQIFTAELKKCIQLYWSLRVDEREAGGPSAANDSLTPSAKTPFSGEFQTFKNKFFGVFFEERCKSIHNEAFPVEDPAQTTNALGGVFENSPPIRVAVDRPASRTTAGARDKSDWRDGADYHDYQSGVLVFGRKKLKPAAVKQDLWRSLNWAKVLLRKKSAAIGVVNGTGSPGIQYNDQALQEMYLSPAAVHEISGLRNSVLTFANERATFVANTQITVNVQERPENDDIEHWFHLHTDQDPNDPPQKLMSMFYGDKYQFSGYTVRNSGALSADLRHPPLTVAAKKYRPLTIPSWNAEWQFSSTVDYTHLRRTRIASPTVIPQQAPITAAFRPLPPNVRPIAHELPEWNDSWVANLQSFDKPNGKQNNANDIVKLDPDKNLILLETEDDLSGLPASDLDKTLVSSDYDFAVRKPLVGFWDWYAWNKPPLSPEVTKLLAADLERREQLKPTTLDTLIDPAVEDPIEVEWQVVFPQLGNIQTISASQSGGPQWIKNSFAVHTFASATKAISVKWSRTRLNVGVPQGMVVRIRIYPLVKTSAFGQKFHAFMQSHVCPCGTTGTYSRAAPVEFWVETAERLKLTDKNDIATRSDSNSKRSQMLWGALIARCDGKKVVAGVDRWPDAKQPDNRRILALVGRYEIWHQTWAWEGHPVAEFPFHEHRRDKVAGRPSPDDLQSETVKWDAVGLSHRPDFSHDYRPSYLSVYRPDIRATKADGKKAAPKHQSVVISFEELHPRDELGLYYRFAIRAYSRYEGIFGPEFLDGLNPAYLEENIISRFKRLYRPAQLTKPLDPPPVRFVMPLTLDVLPLQGSNQPDKGANCESDLQRLCAAVNIVVDERAYSKVGLAERFSVAIRIVTDPSMPAKQNSGPTRYFNAGYDVTLSGKSILPLTDTSNDNQFQMVAPTDLIGPIGLTFDLAAQTPALKGSCFVLRLPLNTLQSALNLETDQSSLPWFMCQVSVRREPIAAGCLIGDRRASGDDQRQADDQFTAAFASDWSAPFWVQFLPNTAMLLPPAWRVAAAAASPIELQIHKSQNSLVIRPEDVPFEYFDDTFEERVERWLVISERVFDAKGDPVEKYQATFRQTQKNSTFALADPVGQDAQQRKFNGFIRVMLLRKRFPNGETPTGENIWDMLLRSRSESMKRPLDPDNPDEIARDAVFALPIFGPRVTANFTIT